MQLDIISAEVTYRNPFSGKTDTMTIEFLVTPGTFGQALDRAVELEVFRRIEESEPGIGEITPEELDVNIVWLVQEAVE